jgi:hypothetical protein
MPIAPKNYITTIDQFGGHWTAVNAAIDPNVFLPGNYGSTLFNTDKTNLMAQLDAVEAAINANQLQIALRDMLRASLKERMRQFNQYVRAQFTQSGHANLVPAIPHVTDGEGKWLKAMGDMFNLWTTINAILPVPPGAPIPLILTGPYTLANFTTDRAALIAAFNAVNVTANDVETAIEQRDVLWKGMYDRMKQYRLTVQGRFAKTDALYLSLPSLTPAAGHTPAAVNVSALWDATLQKAVITYSASAEATLQEYELRGSFGGTKYSADNAVVLGNHPAGNVTPFQTDQGLVASGSKVYYKVYVVLTTGNEKGSATVSVTRP